MKKERKRKEEGTDRRRRGVRVLGEHYPMSDEQSKDEGERPGRSGLLNICAQAHPSNGEAQRRKSTLNQQHIYIL
ncbi:hypothetical protein AVEN_194097-1 [Araneus ventricosus]|uniref:Uncharacterized protein n=1 Tax=Araneus ventricosus TaxID=182803 RepID=A0A4Y2QQJ5_ARAVE|nr:hypothetical protein AVEN_194097-1 [Araneus ventricosus]